MDAPSKDTCLEAEHYRGGHKSNNGCSLLSDNAVAWSFEERGMLRRMGAWHIVAQQTKTKDLVVQKCDD